MAPRFKVPEIPESEKTPLVKLLLEIVVFQQERIEILEDEIARLKGDKPAPKRKPSTLETQPDEDDGDNGPKGKRPGSEKRSKTADLQIHEMIVVPPKQIPSGSTFSGLTTFTVQDLILQTHNIEYRIEHWLGPDGTMYVGELPKDGRVGHFGATLYSYILQQYYDACVTQPLLYQELIEMGVDISTGQVNRIITEGKEVFHAEKASLLQVGLEISSYVNTGDTGTRHLGHNAHCTHIGNQLFAWFETTDHKSRINFLELLRAGHCDYLLSPIALDYMKAQRLPKVTLAILMAHLAERCEDQIAWNAFLATHGVNNERHVRIATEGALLGSVLDHGLPEDFIIISDDAGQFDVLLHGLCWLHAERTLHKLIGISEDQRVALENKTTEIWDYYRDLKTYKLAPDPHAKLALSERFDAIFGETTCFVSLNLALGRLLKNKAELLLVLDHPEIPLHNNESERDIREFVKRRKISGSTRSDVGRRCRDTFASLKKTCRKLGVTFWAYLKDRVSGSHNIPQLGELMRARAREMATAS